MLTKPAARELSIEEVQHRIAALEQSSDLEEIERNQALEHYRVALESLRAAAFAAQQATNYEQSIVVAPKTTADVRRELERLEAESQMVQQPDVRAAETNNHPILLVFWPSFCVAARVT